MMQRALAAACAVLICSCAPQALDPGEQWRALEVAAEPFTLEQEQVGLLRFRGGLVLSSDDYAFGGISDIEVLDDGRLLAISDNGDWFELQLELDASGALVGVNSVRTAFMRDENGRPFATKRDGDSEDLAQLPDGRFAVSFEQTQTIRIYDFNRDGPFGAAKRGPVLADVRRLHRNAGLEAMAATEDGRLLVGAEGGETETTPLWLAPVDDQTPAPMRIGYPPARGYSLTGLDRLPDGGFVALERFYAPVVGARGRITMFTSAQLNAGAETLPGLVVLAELAPPLPVDNFEGVTAVRMSDGATRIYVISDDNFSRRQRTLLYAFDISSAAPSR